MTGAARVVDFPAMWASDKLAACAEWAQAEYAWLYGVADANGCFEITNLRVIWGSVAAIRKNLPLELLRRIFEEFHAHGLLFVWEHEGKRYGHWTGSEKPGRLPKPSRRYHFRRFAPTVPAKALHDYLEAVKTGLVPPEGPQGPAKGASCAGQDLDLVLDLDLGETSSSEVLPSPHPELQPQTHPDSEKPKAQSPGAANRASEHAREQEGPKQTLTSKVGFRLAETLSGQIVANNPSAKVTARQIQNWAREADRMIRCDGRTEFQIRELIEFSQRDSFWRTNILSMAKLREKFDQLTLKKNSGAKGGLSHAQEIERKNLAAAGFRS